MLRLPNEILCHVFHSVPVKDLLSLAVLSRRLHYVALYEYFLRHGMPERPCELRERNISALPGLQKSLYTTYLKTISVVLRNNHTDSLFRLAHQLIQLTSKLSSIGTVDLQLCYSYGAIDLERWRNLFIDLLSSTLRICNDIRVCGSVMDQPSLEDIRYHYLRAIPLKRFVGKVSGRSNRRDVSISEPLTNGRLKQLEIGSRMPSRVPFPDCPQLNFSEGSVALRSIMLLHPPFLDWTQHILGESSITRLSIGLWGIHPHVSSSLITKVNLPCLLYASIAGRINLISLWTFTTRHPSITNLTLRILPIMSFHRIPVDSLPNLQTLDINAPLAPAFLTQRISSFLRLRRITIFAPAQQNPNDESRKITDITSALECIAQRTGPLELNLKVASVHPHIWINHYLRNMETKTSRILGCVNSLRLRFATTTQEPERTLESLPRWLAFYFPALQILSLDIPLETSDPAYTAFVRSVDAIVPLITSIAINGTEHTILEWLA